MTAPSPRHAPLRTAPPWGLAVAVSVGALIAVQGRINSGLAAELGGGAAGAILAATISFGSGVTLLTALVLSTSRRRGALRSVRAALRHRSGGPARLRWWHLLGGVSGAFFVASQGLTVGALGVAVFTVAVVAGQTVSGLVVDRLGAGPSGVQPVTGRRLAGAVVTLLAVALAVSDRFGSGPTLALAVLPAVAGAGMAWQSAVNGRVGVAADSPVTAAWVNFAVGAVLLVVAATVVVAVHGGAPRLPGDPLLYLGGITGVVFVTATTWVVRTVGVLVLGLGTVTGQLLGAVVLDLALPQPGTTLALTTVVGSALTILGVLVATSRPTRRRPEPVPA